MDQTSGGSGSNSHHGELQSIIEQRRDWNTFLQYLENHRPPLSLSRCSSAHVLEFLKYLDQFGTTKVHLHGCVFFGHPNPPAPCSCPMKQAWRSLDALIERLRAAYEENGGTSESNLFKARAVRIYLREVRQSQAKARGIANWSRGRTLGSGSFGNVYEGISKEGVFFAVKEVSLLDHGSQGRQCILQLEQEIALLSQFQHENIVRYLGTEKDESKLYIFLELVTKGSLAQLYQQYNLQDSQVSAYTRQILNALKYLHDQNLLHRDIKCANILVDANGSVKLADFGLAKVLNKLNDVKSSKGTALWMAPEVVDIKRGGYGLGADIWSLGCTVLEMLTRQPPYFHLESMQALFKIGKGKPPLVPDFLSSDAKDFIHKCLQDKPYNRPTAAQLLEHSFVKKPIG